MALDTDVHKRILHTGKVLLRLFTLYSLMLVTAYDLSKK